MTIGTLVAGTHGRVIPAVPALEDGDRGLASLDAHGCGQSPEVPGTVNLRNSYGACPGRPVLGAGNIQDMTNPSDLIFCCPTCGNSFPKDLDDLLVDLVRGADQEIPGALQLIYQERILWVERKVNTELIGGIDPTCTCDQTKTFYETFNLPFPQRNSGPDGAGVRGDPEPQEPAQDSFDHPGKPLRVSVEHESGHSNFCGCEYGGYCPCTDPGFCVFCWADDCGGGCYG